jgi:CubicO group peptidase (beta-lactamase class C family)
MRAPVLFIAAFAAAPLPAQRPSPADVNTLLDSLLPAAVRASHVPGAVVAVVRNDSVVALRGYGLARLEDSVRADPTRSIYRLASVAKLFVATTVLERVAAGRLDLDRDIQAYAPDVPIPGTFPAAITLRHLLTHTAGFDERVIGYAAPSRAEMRPLGAYLAARLPDRGWAPGSLVGYSNHGMALAAYIAEREAGESYDALATRSVFAPFGMARTYYIEPPDESLAGDLAPGYRCGPSGCERAPVVWSHAYPVGLAYSTAADMSRFMRAWLHGGVLDGTQVLDPRTVQAALTQQFTHDPRLPGIGFAFFEQRSRGHRVLAHAGGVPGTATVLALAPGERLGVFIATNAGEPGVPRTILDGLLARLLPDETGPAPMANGPVDEYVGHWILARYSHRTVERFPGAFAFAARTRALGDTLLMPAGSGVRRFVRVDSLLLQEVADGTRLALRRDAAGRITHLFAGLPSGGAELPGAFERVPWYEGAYFLNEYTSWLVMTPVLVLLLWGVVSLGRWGWRRWKVRDAGPPRSRGRLEDLIGPSRPPVNPDADLPAQAGIQRRSPGPWWAIVTAVAAEVLLLLFMFGLVAASTRDLGRGQGIAFGMTAMHVALLRSAWLIAAAAIPVTLYAWISWRRRWWGLFGRLCYSALAVCSIGAAHFLVWWNYIPGRW